MKKGFAFLLAAVLLLASACAEGIGQTYKAFEASYAENVVFINANTGRMLLPHTLQRDYDDHGKRMYRINRGGLAVEMHMDESGERIARLIVSLTAPDNMQYGDTIYSDFATAGYHSYAILMAMDSAQQPADRYSVVERVNQGIKQNGGVFENKGEAMALLAAVKQVPREGKRSTTQWSCVYDQSSASVEITMDMD